MLCCMERIRPHVSDIVARPLFNSYSKLILNCFTDSLAALVLLPYSIFIWNWYKLPSWQLGCSSAPCVFKSYSKLKQIALLTIRLLYCSFLIYFLFKTGPNPLLVASPPPVRVSDSVLIQNWYKSSFGWLASSWAHFLSQGKEDALARTSHFQGMQGIKGNSMLQEIQRTSQEIQSISLYFLYFWIWHGHTPVWLLRTTRLRKPPVFKKCRKTY